MKIIRHKEKTLSDTYDNYFYSYKYDFNRDGFVYKYSFHEPPTKENAINISDMSNAPFQNGIENFSFYKEIEKMKHVFIKDGEWHLFPNLIEKLDRVLNEDN